MNDDIIQITNQSCFQQEKYFEDGKQKLVFVVVKNQPFRLGVELTDKGNQMDLDIRNFEWSASLVYNVEDKKPVPFINQEPFTYKFSHFNDKKTTVECRIVVLTSQHEDVFFLIRINAEYKNTEIPHTYTFPIKVISKPEQPKKRKVITENLKPQKKRQTKAEKLLQILEEIQQKQQKQEENLHYLKQKLINLNFNQMNQMNNMNMMNNMNNNFNQMNNNINNNNMNQMNNMNMMNTQIQPHNFSQPIPTIKVDTNKIKKEKLEFEPLLVKLLDLYKQLPNLQKKEKLQNAIKRLPTTFLMREFYDLLIGEGLENDSSKLDTSNPTLENSITWNIPGMQDNDGSNATLSSKTVNISGFEFEFLDFEENPTHCTCEVCPYKQELERIESFTKEIFPGN